MDKKKIGLIAGIAAVVLVIIILLITSMKAKDEQNKKDVVYTFFSYIEQEKYEEMYELISETSKQKISKEDFVKRNKNIYGGIDATNITIEIEKIIKEGKRNFVSYNESFVTRAGEVAFSNKLELSKEDGYKIEWSSKLIFPELLDEYKVRISTIEAKRGSINDRKGNPLAYDGKISTVGIVPGKLSENKEEDIKKISELLGMSVEKINRELSASYVKDDIFVQLKKIEKDSEIKEKLLEIPGVKIASQDGRVYPLGEEAAHLIGYIQEINSEELEKRKGEGYTSTSLIGKSGLELVYEEKLRGIDGAEIYIEDENGIMKTHILKRDKKDGEDVKITIDSELQRDFYNQMKEDEGLFVAMSPETGELLALVSTPSYNSNDFILGFTTEEWNALNNDERMPLYNRFKQAYCPGSTFKPITAAIALTDRIINENETFTYSGTSWQNDKSWGDYYVTTLTEYPEDKNVKNALIRSDNIFFAQLSMKIGKTGMSKYLDNLGFNENLEFPISLKKSQYLNEEKEMTDLKLANTGYGQGDVLVNPIHMASIYSAFANNGDMLKPYIEYKDGEKTILKENVFSEEAVKIVSNALKDVVESPNGTANDAKIAGLEMIGKTGTAELKKSKEDTQSGTLGWFNCITLNREEGNLVIVGMVENSQDNSSGGSHYVISKIKQVLSK